MKKTISKVAAFVLTAAVMLTGLGDWSFIGLQASAQVNENSLGATAACDGHTLGTFNDVPACVNANGGLHVCENNFPDENFRKYLSTMTIGYTGYYETAEKCPGILQVENREIYSLQGIEYFSELKTLRSRKGNPCFTSWRVYSR